MAEATIAQAAAAEQSGNRNARTSDSSRQTATYRDKVPPMPYGLNPAALPFTPQAVTAETQTPKPEESSRTGVNTKGLASTGVDWQAVSIPNASPGGPLFRQSPVMSYGFETRSEETRGNTDLDREEDDSGSGVQPIYNTSLETLEGLLGTQVTRKDRSRTPPEKPPDNKKKPHTQAANSAITCKFWITGQCKRGDAETRVDLTTTCIALVQTI